MKTTNAKEMIKEYDCISFNAVGFGSWLMEHHFYSSLENGEVLYKIVGDKNYNHNHKHTMKELYELYMYENNKNYIHK